MKEFIINENEAGQRFDKYLAKLLREAPKSFFYKMMRKKNITLNGKKATGNEKLFSGDHVKLFLSDETFEKFSGNDSAPRAHYALDIIYEDENILLINKPAGMLSQPADDGTPSLVEYLTGYLLKNGSLTENDLRTFRPSVCNRLDRNTSGLIAAGKSLSGLQELSGMFKSRELHKYYLCLVEGVLKEERYIKGYLAKDKKSNKADKKLKGQLLHSFRMEFPSMKGSLSYLSGKVFTAPLPEIFLRTLKEEKLEESYYENLE